MLRRNRWLATVVLVCTAALTACGGGDEESDAQAESSESSSPEGGEESSANFDDVPDVVAEVNGEEISKEDFTEAYEPQAQQAASMAQMQGGEAPDEKQLRDQVVESLVTQELLAQEVEERGIDPTDDEVEKTLEDAAKQSGMKSTDELVKALEGQGLDADEVQEQAQQQAAVEQLLAEETGPIKVSDKEVKALYEQYSAQSGGQGGKTPSLKKLRPQLEDQVKSQQESEAAQKLIGQLREDADVTINL